MICLTFVPYDIILIFNRKIKYIDFLSFVCINLQTFLQKKDQAQIGIHKVYAIFYVKIGIICTLSYSINNIYLILYVCLFYPLGRICA